MKTQCPSCETNIELEKGIEEKSVKCSECGREIFIFDQDSIASGSEEGQDDVQPEVGSGPPEIPGFRLVREIGRGGMGVVWEAVQLSLDRSVALKVLPAELADREDFVARFERESTALAKLSHPNIVSIIDRGKAGEIYYFVMEYIEGEGGGPSKNLGDLMRSGDLDSVRTLRLITQVCEALAYAHSQGIIHRDVKPANVLIDMHGNARVVDFGIANIARVEGSQVERLTLADASVGTPTYMAPEQTRDAANVDHRADIFSTGVMIYEMLTGQLPYGSFEPPSKLIPNLDPRWDAIVDKATRQSADGRFSDMNEMLSALAKISDSQIATLTLPDVSSETPVTPQTPVAGKCPECGVEVITGKKFCPGCGASLFLACPECGTEHPAWEKFCGECGVDLTRLFRVARYIENAKKHISLTNDPSAKPTERFEHCEKACISLGRALKANPEDEEIAKLLKQTEKIRPTLALEAADYALRHHEFGLALQLCKVILEDDPQNEIIRTRLEKIEKARAVMIEKAQSLRARGNFKQCLRVLSEAARVFPDDEEVRSLHEEASAEYQCLSDTVTAKIPALRRERRYVELAEVLQEMIREHSPVRGLRENLENALKRIKLAKEYEARAQDTLEIGQYGEGRDLAKKALGLVSDLSEARTVLDKANSAIAGTTSSRRQIESALSSGKWFTARVLLRDAVRSRPEDKKMARKLQEAEYHAFKQSNCLRLLLWTLAGGILWVTAKLISSLLCQAIGEVTRDISIGGVTIAKDELQIAFEISLHCSFAVILLTILVSILSNKAMWEEIILAFVALISGPLSVISLYCIKPGSLQVISGVSIQSEDLAIVAGFGLQGLILSAVARSMFTGVSPGLPFSWLVYGIVGSLLGIYVRPGSTGVAQEGIILFVSYAYFGLIIAALLSAFSLVEGWWRYLLLPVISVSCYATLRGAELTDIRWLRSLLIMPVICLFGASSQLGLMQRKHLFIKRILIITTCALAWYYWPKFVSGKFGNTLLLIIAVWVLWCAALRFHLRRWLEPGVHLGDFARSILLRKR